MAENRKFTAFFLLFIFLSIPLISYGKDVYTLDKLLKCIKMPSVPFSIPINNTKISSYLSYVGTSIELHIENEGTFDAFQWNISGVVATSPSIHAELVLSPVSPQYSTIYSSYLELLNKRWTIIDYYYKAWKNRLEKEDLRLEISEYALKKLTDDIEYEKLCMKEELLDVDYLKIVDDIGSSLSLAFVELAFPGYSVTPISTDIGKYIKGYLTYLDAFTYIPKDDLKWGVKVIGDYGMNENFAAGIGGYVDFPLSSGEKENKWKTWREKQIRDIIVKFKSLLMRYSVITRYVGILNEEIEKRIKEFSSVYSEYLSGKKVEEKTVSNLELEIEKLRNEKRKYEIEMMKISSTLNAVFL